MDILAAIKREERKLEKQLGKLQHKLTGVRAAAKALGGSVEREVVGVKKRVAIGCGKSGDSEGGEEEMGEGEEGSEKETRLVYGYVFN
jgi:hypothetical protein